MIASIGTALAWFAQLQVAQATAGDVLVARSSGTSLGAAQLWGEDFCFLGETCAIGDVNGDGLADAVRFAQSGSALVDPWAAVDPSGLTNDVWVGLSNSGWFMPEELWSDDFCDWMELCMLGDVNGDGLDDLIATGSQGHLDQVRVALSTGSGFAPAEVWTDDFCDDERPCAVGDVDGDGDADLVEFEASWWSGPFTAKVALSDGGAFGASQLWNSSFCQYGDTCTVGDVNGDGRADLLSFDRTNGTTTDSDVWVALSTGTAFRTASKWQDYFCTLNEFCAVGDVTGDGREDAVTFVRTNSGVTDSDVWVGPSEQVMILGRTGMPSGTIDRFGTGEKWHDFLCTLDNTCALGDVDGDGREDAIAFRRR
ncbi:MAG: FG-GAP-like repeat-containing protein [Myxococcota bacterium]